MSNPDHPGVLQHLKGLLWNGREDLLGLHAVAQRAAMDQLMRRNIERQFAISDAQIQKCNPDYKPPEKDEEMSSPVFINAGIMGNEITQEIANMLGAKNASDATTGGNDGNGGDESQPTQPTSNQSTQPGTTQLPRPRRRRKRPPTLGALAWDGLKKALPLLAVAGVSIAAAKYFAPEDQVGKYDIEALPYAPQQPGQPGQPTQPTSSQPMWTRPQPVESAGVLTFKVVK